MLTHTQQATGQQPRSFLADRAKHPQRGCAALRTAGLGAGQPKAGAAGAAAGVQTHASGKLIEPSRRAASSALAAARPVLRPDAGERRKSSVTLRTRRGALSRRLRVPPGSERYFCGGRSSAPLTGAAGRVSDLVVFRKDPGARRRSAELAIPARRSGTGIWWRAVCGGEVARRASAERAAHGRQRASGFMIPTF